MAHKLNRGDFLGFEDNILECFNDLPSFCEPIFKAVMLGDNAVYLQGVKGLKSFSRDCVCLFLRKGEVQVQGENLYIKKYCAGDIAVCGKILSVSRK